MTALTPFYEVNEALVAMAAVAGPEDLGISTLHASHIPLGSGFIKTAHGVIPVPAPDPAVFLKGMN